MIWHQREGQPGRYGINWKCHRCRDGRRIVRVMLMVPSFRRTLFVALHYSTGYGFYVLRHAE